VHRVCVFVLNPLGRRPFGKPRRRWGVILEYTFNSVLIYKNN